MPFSISFLKAFWKEIEFASLISAILSSVSRLQFSIPKARVVAPSLSRILTAPNAKFSAFEQAKTVGSSTTASAPFITAFFALVNLS